MNLDAGVVKALGKCVCISQPYGCFKRTAYCEICHFRRDRPSVQLAHDFSHFGVGEGDFERGVDEPLDNLTLVQSREGGFPVGLYESAHTQFGPAKIPHNNSEAIRNLFASECPQDWRTCRIVGFPIIVGPEHLSLRPQTVCVAVMTGRVVLLAKLLQVVFDFLFGGNRENITQMLGTFGLEKALTWGFDSEVAIG